MFEDVLLSATFLCCKWLSWSGLKTSYSCGFPSSFGKASFQGPLLTFFEGFIILNNFLLGAGVLASTYVDSSS